MGILKLKLMKIGTSHGVVLPKAVLESIDARLGDKIKLEIHGVVKERKRHEWVVDHTTQFPNGTRERKDTVIKVPAKYDEDLKVRYEYIANYLKRTHTDGSIFMIHNIE